MKPTQIFTSRFFAKQKVRFDRGRIYWSYIQAPVTALLVLIFTIDIDWKYKVGSALSSFVLIYIMGFFDDIKKVINDEQEIYAKKNKVFMDILDRLDKIESKL